MAKFCEGPEMPSYTACDLSFLKIDLHSSGWINEKVAVNMNSIVFYAFSGIFFSLFSKNYSMGLIRV